MVTYKLNKEDKRYFTEPILSEEEWLNVLHLSDNDKHRRQVNTLLMFFYQPEHKAICAAIGKEYSMDYTAVNSLITHYGQFVKAVCGKECRIEKYENQEETFWPIVMHGKELKNHFEWQLRPELVNALRRFLLEKLLAAYRGPVLAEGLDNSRSEELYKWRLLSKTRGKSTLEILKIIGTSSENNILTWRTKESIRTVLKNNPEQIEDCFNALLLEDGSFYDRYQAFVEKGKAFMSKVDAERILKEKEACLFLACKKPEDNAIYKWSLYKDACSYLGIDTKASRPVDGYLSILNDIIELEKADAELTEKLEAETADYFWSELLNAQDVLFQMQLFMQSSRPKNWLQQIYDQAIASKDWVYQGWYPEYLKTIERFKEMFQEGKTAADVDDETKEYLIRTPENYISSNLQGTYSYAEFAKIIEYWPKMYEIFQRCLESASIPRAEYDAMNQLIQPALSKKHPAAFHRMWAGIFPELLTTTIADSKFRNVYERIRAVDSSLPESSGHWLEDNIALMDYFKQKVTFKEPLHRGLFAWYLYDNLSITENTKNMNKYIQLLEANKNLILTGAPGTGKTYLAKQIAKEMGDDNPGFVQFHPSYDYTDFVEGLRPIGENTFERVNGVFKQFCADALLHSSSVSFDEAYDRLIKDLSERQDPMEVQTNSKSAPAMFGILVNSRGNIDLYTGKPLKNNGSLTRERIKNCDSQIYWQGYYKGVKKLLVDKYGLEEGTTIYPTKHVFIIDEINRGELSKIFGELFFALDPGYRGEKGRVKTQYQNLVEPGDPFEKGFYVPDNVYIIGTMNDIDRGVESMDFAIRRRFAWSEVKVEDRVEMLDEVIPEWSDAAKRCMSALNEALKEKGIGLTSAYDIGPAYFLKLEMYDGDFEKLWEYHIQGILAEYLRGTRGIEEKMVTLKEAFDKYKE